uniref:GUN4-like domain-containing protein n=1 Tax=Fibrocapsa japonica TaxID=94617 RepID=A0A7S2UZV4_9STRA|mmetsp:Transcript_22401/g.32516  ORF Transcript_22401/g.32516 Transcript_22401/m.32516 type:complete len:228 (+) Transcript_22401:68-751(+)|eukprot:CAMPEP_0113933970 /NCGR_PEP_ID=MMETSP1339-20121228/1327_1 /TAXON_ID=94617 /ORGANISM="Fibrocapsa japonica" /LENGTH=227 /DNA_ID=CAMNT_0000935565 /DNA_START=67 /DNA_END=750 /DNA_ORIENTATION=- /assembly_acc=CAM_ASM_000762
MERIALACVSMILLTLQTSAFVQMPVGVTRQSPTLHTRTIHREAVGEVEAAVVEAVSKEELPSPDDLPSSCGVDYIPLATMLMTGDFEAADQFTRDNLIFIAGEKAQERGFVYWTQVKDLPPVDMATMERLWLKYSNGKFGYTMQRKLYRLGKGNFEAFCRKVDWNVVDEGVERKRRWFGKSEFIYDLEKAPRGHLPLTSALRGTTLLKELMNYPAWDNEEFQAKKN